MSRNADILSKQLNREKLKRKPEDPNLNERDPNLISYQDIINTVSTFKSIELQKAFMYALLTNDVMYAQELMGMKLDCSDHYPNYMAAITIGKNELKKIEKLGQFRQYMQEPEIMSHKYIPQDVKDAYQKFIT